MSGRAPTVDELIDQAEMASACGIIDWTDARVTDPALDFGDVVASLGWRPRTSWSRRTNVDRAGPTTSGCPSWRGGSGLRREGFPDSRGRSHGGRLAIHGEPLGRRCAGC